MINNINNKQNEEVSLSRAYQLAVFNDLKSRINSKVRESTKMNFMKMSMEIFGHTSEEAFAQLKEVLKINNQKFSLKNLEAARNAKLGNV